MGLPSQSSSSFLPRAGAAASLRSVTDTGVRRPAAAVRLARRSIVPVHGPGRCFLLPTLIDPSAVGREEPLQVMEPLPPAEVADMLSTLPAHLLDEILARLDLRDAVRTSVLSCAWRRRWESLPGLALCFPRGTRPSVVARVLLRYTGPSISRFACYVGAADDVGDVDDWVIALSRRGVESISIIKEPGDGSWCFTLHYSIFSCDRLVSLSLQDCFIPPLPPRSGFAGFPVLQELCLRDVDVGGFQGDERALQAIIRGSPLLRVLELVGLLAPVGGCVIEAPNLQTLVLDSEFDTGWQFGRLPRLQYAKIDVHEYDLDGHGRHRLLDFFAGVSQVRKLIFYSPANHDEVKIDRIPFTFHNLKSLEISTFFVYMEPVLLLFSLLRSSPNLKELKIKIRDWEAKGDTNSGILSEEWIDAQWTGGMCANLQVVHFFLENAGEDNYPGWFSSLSFMKLILFKASLLRTLSVCPVSQDDPLKELLKCRRASAQAQVLFKALQEDLHNDTDGELNEWA